MTGGALTIRALVIDNYDSFTYNLCHYLADCADAEIVVVRNDEPRFRLDDLDSFDCVIISPGPGRPDRPDDFGFCADVMLAGKLPILGVCLGLQGMCYAFGGSIDVAPEPYHGRLSRVFHTGDELFEAIPSPFLAVRYHSLIAARIPRDIKVIARTEDGLPMGVRHRSLPFWGVQFHPESVCTEYGHRLLTNFLQLTSESLGAGKIRRECSLSELTWSAPRSESCGAAWAGARRFGTRSASPNYRVLVRKLARPADAESIFHALYRHSDNAFWLDSSLLKVRGGETGDQNGGQFSFMGDASGPLARIARFDVPRAEITVANGEHRTIHKGSFFSWMKNDLDSFNTEVPPLPFNFALGWVGYLGYELKGQTSGDHVHDSAHPDAAMVFADRAIAFDHGKDELYLLALARCGDEAPAAEWLDDAQRQIECLRPAPPSDEPVLLDVGEATLRHDRDAYLRLIEDCKREIWAGESYEICLTNMVEVAATLSPWPAYRKLRRDNPVPYGAYLRFADLSVLSCSPERLLWVSADGEAESKPIKGTRPRGHSAADDGKLRNDLARNIKDRAENLMIVDLIRNDLGSCAEVGSVIADPMFDVETYSSVHQLVSTVRARLRPGLSATDCVRAIFPGGSMTGAPKIRTMQIIDRLESGPRGIYSGSIGYFSLSGALDLSITIRTLVAVPGKIQWGVGGAIIALSDPEAEFEETAVKAAALLSLIGQEFPQRHRRA